MRRLVLVLMLALLPLRAWVGDAMAMEMSAAALAHSTYAIDSVALHDHSARNSGDSHADHAMHADCPELAAEHSDSPDHGPHAVADCDTCTACQICHTVALTPLIPHLAPAPQPAAQPQASSHHFASAERAPGFKPPIS